MNDVNSIVPNKPHNIADALASGMERKLQSVPLSIVIPCKNEVDYIGNLLESLIAQSYDVSNIPIFLADAGSTDGTIEFVENFRQSSGLDIQIVGGGFPSSGRNSGARQCKSKYILFLDADIYLDETDFIERLIQTADSRNLDCIGTLVRCENPDWRDKLVWNLLTIFMYAYPLMKPFSTGMCIFIRRSAFDYYGGFDETVFLGEDVELTSQIDKKKFGIIRRHVVTTNRRFQKMGYLKTMIMYIQIHFNRKYRHKDHRAYFGM